MGETTNLNWWIADFFQPSVQYFGQPLSLESVDVASKDLLQMFQRSAEELGKPQGGGSGGGAVNPNKKGMYYGWLQGFLGSTPQKNDLFGSGNSNMLLFSSPIWGRFSFFLLVFFKWAESTNKLTFWFFWTLDDVSCIKVWFWQMWQCYYYWMFWYSDSKEKLCGLELHIWSKGLQKYTLQNVVLKH